MAGENPSDLIKRTRLWGAIAAGNLASAASRVAKRGSGVSIKGKIIRTLAPDALQQLLADKQTFIVTGTNGKTTSTHLLTAALRTQQRSVVTNADGANLQYGIVSAVSSQPHAPIACLETDERAVCDVLLCGKPEAFVILNLSRDQLDRHHEITSLARSWRETLTALGTSGPVVVATIDDPLVVWAASAGKKTVWVDVGSTWTQDASLCPACGSVLRHETTEHGKQRWSCPTGDLVQPTPDYVVEGRSIHTPDGACYTPDLQVPGQFNVGNAACMLAAAQLLDIAPEPALTAMSSVQAPAGRFAQAHFGHADCRLMLAKNPAGWATCLPLVEADTVVLAIDSQYADGQDVSWLWDVDFESLAGLGKRVIATGYRGKDLAVRLLYADVDHEYVPDLATAVSLGTGAVDVVSTYTPFQQLLALGGLK
ncbi:MAG: MurT ligase domain-containing protein [Propionibacteriaceae bacterium]